MKKRGRPAGVNYSERFQLKLTQAERELLDVYSSKLKQDKSDIIRKAISEYITRHSDNSFTMPMFK